LSLFFKACPFAFRETEEVKEIIRFESGVAITKEDLLNDLKTCIDVMNRLHLSDAKLQLSQWKLI
jgi:hypothetical protein